MSGGLAASGEPLVTGPWSDEEVGYLRFAYRRETTKEIAHFLDRTPQAVVSKAHRLGLCPARSA
jgi:hypothetical protein